MDDINFDELDKAVNSALRTNETPVDPAFEQPAVPPSAPATVTTTSVAPPSVPERAPSSPVMPTPRRGQFMDMVHPSSDMTSSPQPAAAVPSSARKQQPTIRPLDSSLVRTSSQPDIHGQTNDAVASIVSAAVEPSSGPSNDTERAPSPVIDTPEHTGTDSLAIDQESAPEETAVSFGGDDQSAAITSAEDGFSAEEAQGLVTSESSPEAQEIAPVETAEKSQSSPFIEGAEVEKRPLGGFVGPVAKEDEAATDAPASDELPQELSADVVSVESDDPVLAVNRENNKEIDAAETLAVPSSSNNVAQSIPQQYVPETGASDEEDHSVFDTQQYHQPLTPPAKKHKGLGAFKYILIGLLLLALGAAGGYVFYLLS